MSDEYAFPGFSSPNFTQVPDEFFDALMPDLSESELKVLLYVFRRTFGFKKDTDTISLKQMVEGITTRDGRQLDRGTGLSKSSAARGISGLVKKGIIVATRNTSREKGYEATTYQLKFKDADPLSQIETRVQPPLSQIETSPPLSQIETSPSPKLEQALVPNWDIQKTVVQETDEQETDLSNDSIDHTMVLPKAEIERVAWVTSDIALEFADRATAKASATRAARLYATSGLDLDSFLDLMQLARLRTKRYTGGITAERGADGRKPKMQYWFSVLENLIKLNPELSQSAD